MAPLHLTAALPSPISDAHALIRFQHGGRDHLRADGRQIDERRRVAVDGHFHAVLDPDARRAARAFDVERGLRFVDGDRRMPLPPRFTATRVCDASCASTRTSHALSVGSSLMRLISAVPREVPANWSSIAMMPGLVRMM